AQTITSATRSVSAASQTNEGPPGKLNGSVSLASSLGPFRRFNLAHPKLLIPLARLFLPHPIYKESSKLGECGNREAISKGSGKGGKPDVGFPGFPLPV